MESPCAADDRPIGRLTKLARGYDGDLYLWLAERNTFMSMQPHLMERSGLTFSAIERSGELVVPGVGLEPQSAIIIDPARTVGTD